MPRTARTEVAGVFHHVTGKGSSDLYLFPDGASRMVFLGLVGEVAIDLGWEVAAYCPLGTHHHLVVRPPDESLGIGMRRLNGAYGSWLNHRLGRRGPVWGDRFHSVPLMTPRHLSQAVLYVDLNPVEAALARLPWDWEWGSARANAGLAAPWPWHRPDLARHAVGAINGHEYRERVECELERRHLPAAG